MLRFLLPAALVLLPLPLLAGDPAASRLDPALTGLLQKKTAAAWTVLVLLLSWESLAPFFPFFRGALAGRAWHAVKNFLLGTVNSLVISACIVTVWNWSAAWTEAHRFGLFHWMPLPEWARTVGAILLLDVWMYKWHWMNHRFRFLWRFHRVHHTDAQMDVTTASRFHLGEITLSSALRVPLLFVSGVRLWEVILYEAILFAVVQFQHANVALPPRLDALLRGVIVTPAMHKVHHSRWQPETDSNYASLFSWWDRVFGTFRARAELRELNLGLDGYDAPARQSLMGMMATPLDKPDERDER